jgi:transposase
MPSALADGDHQADWVEVPAQARELLRVLLPHLSGLDVSRVADAGDTVVAFASVAGAQAPCPGCGSLSSRVHGRYQRLVADRAAGGRPLLIALSVRRFRCTSRSCPRVTFVEQAEGLTGRYLRRTLPLREMLARFGLELAGRAGARLAAVTGIAVHSSTLLRLVMALPDPAVTAAPAVTGVDDFALRKARSTAPWWPTPSPGRSSTCCPTATPPPWRSG